MEEKEFVIDSYDFVKEYLEKDVKVGVSVKGTEGNRENRRKEMKRHNSNSHELNIGRINPIYTKEKDFYQKQKKKQFNDFIKGKVK